VWCFYVWRENETEGQNFIPGAGARFRLSRDLRKVVIHESLQESSAWRVGQVLSMQGVSIWVVMILSILSDSLPLQSSHSMFGVLMDLRSRVWIWLCLYYHYDYCIYLSLTLAWINVWPFYACSSL
jgi:hypothetical protein